MATVRLRDRIRYVVEDMRIRACQLERDRWFTKDELEERVAENVFAAAVLRQEALRLEKMADEDEASSP